MIARSKDACHSKLKILLLSTTVALAASTVAQAGGLGDIFNSVASVVASPVKAVGWVIGQGANAAVDPMIDNAFGRIRETTDHAISRFDETAKTRIDQIDAKAKDRLDQLDKIAKERIQQLDAVMKSRLDQVDTILDEKLVKIEEIATTVLNREAQILDQNVTRVDEILTKSLDRLQEIETNAFDRVDSALQDQVPFAASQVARSIEWTIVVIVFVVVLVGYGGVQMMRALANATTTPLKVRFQQSFSFAGKSLITVGLPMVFLLTIVQIGYVAYYTTADQKRIARLDDAGHLLELAGDFKAATNLRNRAFALDGIPSRRYMVVRDQWLADFWQRHLGENPVELSRRLNHLIDTPSTHDQIEADGEIQAANLYLQVTYSNDLTAPANAPAAIQATRARLVDQIAKYKRKFLYKTNSKDGPDAVVSYQDQVPVLGKLVAMAEIRLILDDQTRDVQARLTTAGQIVNELLSAKAYSRYAPGLLLRAQFTSAQFELRRDSFKYKPDKVSEKDRISEETIRAAIQQDADAAFAADPELARYVRFRTASLPPDLVTVLKTIGTTPPDKRAALRNPAGTPLEATAASQLDLFAHQLYDLVDPLLGIPSLTQAKVERQICRAIRLDLGEADLNQKITESRTKYDNGIAPEALLKLYLEIIESATNLGKPQLAEAWLAESQQLIMDHPSPFLDARNRPLADQLKTIKKPEIASSMFYVF